MPFRLITKWTSMTVQTKTADELAKMRIAGKLASEVLEMIGPFVVPGVTTGELDRLCHHHIVEVQKAIPAPLNYNGFPKSICTSVNHVVCHGIPSDDKILKVGDIVNIDVTVIKDGYHGDTSKMFCVGEVADHVQRLRLSKHTARAITILSCVNTADTALGASFTKSRKSCIMARQERVLSSKKA